MLVKLLKSSVVIAIMYASYLLILLSLPYLSFKSNTDFLSSKQFVYHIEAWRWSFYAHVFSSVFIVIFGLFQFFPYFIHKQKRIHRIFGYLYLSILLLISAPAALIMSFYANGGYPAQIGFVILSILWISSSSLSLYYVKKKNFEKHGNYLLRSYALTLSAITLRFYAFLFDYFNVNLGPVETYILVSYLGWIPNLILAEILIKRGFIRSMFRVG